MDSILIESISSAGKSLLPVRFPDGSCLLVMPYGGRILGLYPPGDDRNFFWVNPHLGEVAAARTFFASPVWQNLGGDRTWIGPEIDFFFPHWPDQRGYRPPDPLDASTYAFSISDARLSLAFSVQSTRAREPLGLVITKSIGPARNPLLEEGAAGMPASLRYAGYTLTTTLEFASDPGARARAGVWNLVQLPHRGEMIIPVLGLPEATVFFGTVPPGHLRIASGFARHRMAAPGEHKIGFHAAEVAGRAGYLVRGREEAQLVVRRFAVDPAGLYPDVPAASGDARGFCFEDCNVSNETLGSFSELEYHAPAVAGSELKSADVSQLWAYRGPPDAVALAAERVLGLPRESVWEPGALRLE